jgi:peptidoglycan/LPS O-acetylase OafA/YrhL
MLAVGGEMRRVAYLDGLRGIAALVVVVSHIVTALFPHLHFGLELGVAPSWQTLYAASPLFVAINGSFAVCIFFTLSGFVISSSADKTSTPLIGSAFARVLRLGVPASLSIAIAGVLTFGGLIFPKELFSLTGHWWILRWHPEPSVAKVLTEMGGRYFVTGGSHYIPVLWTMQRELAGSVAIYALFFFAKADRSRFVGCLLLAAAVVITNIEPHYYLCFCGGVALYLLRDNLAVKYSNLGLVALALGLIAGGYPFTAPTPGTFYDLPMKVFSELRLSPLYVWTLGSILIVGGLLVSRVAQRTLSGVTVRFFGRISFSVYLVHFPLLGSILAGLYVSIGYLSAYATLACILVYVSAVVLAATIFTILVDEPAQRFAKKAALLTWFKSPARAPATPNS